MVLRQDRSCAPIDGTYLRRLQLVGSGAGEQNGLLVVIGMVKGALLFFAARGEAATGFRAGGGQDAAGSGWAGHCWAEEKNDKLGRVLRMVGVREGRRC